MLAFVTESAGTHGSLQDVSRPEPKAGEVLIRAEYSSINFKDALGATGTGKIYKKFPIIGGIDVAGTIEDTGEKVVVTGCGLGEDRDGGYSEYACVPEDWVVPLPEGLSTREAMIIGTAGFTAALCLERFSQNHQAKDEGPIVVTGASGGVGMLAVQMLQQDGYEVIAVSSKKERHVDLKKLGATMTVTPDDLELGQRPLEKSCFSGAIDNVGGEMLAGLSRHIGLWGNIACVGLASDYKLNATVMPMILRGVSLLGISSTNTPMPWRKKVWQRLADRDDLFPGHLNDMPLTTVALSDIEPWFGKMINRETYGRTLVKIS